MAQEVSLSTSEPVNVMCFTYQNPSSINGPFGTFELWVSGSSVLGRMTLNLLFGLPSITNLNLEGTLSGTSPIVCKLQGKGYASQTGSSPVSADLGVTVTFASDWSTGELSFSSGVTGFPGGLPVQRVECQSS